MNTKVNFTRINNDINGNPRYVCHFSDIATEKDREKAEEIARIDDSKFYISHLYDVVVKKANKIGGRRYHTKTFGGGIVFQSYNIEEDIKHIFNL